MAAGPEGKPHLINVLKKLAQGLYEIGRFVSYSLYEIVVKNVFMKQADFVLKR